MRYAELTDNQKKIAERNGFCALFAERGSITEAMDYMNEAIDTLKPSEKILMITAVGILNNVWAVRYAYEVGTRRDVMRKLKEGKQ